MTNKKNSLPTRTSLIRRLQEEEDGTKWQRGWEEFYLIYRPLVFGVSRQAGLNAEEAEDVVQEVMAELGRRIHGFELNRQRGPFKAWLLNLVRWRITDQLRKRLPIANRMGDTALEEATAAATDAGNPFTDEIWETAWRKRLFDEAVERVRAKAEEKQFQLFKIFSSQKIRAREVAKSFGVSTAQVWLAKHRISAMIKKEIKRLEKELVIEPQN